MLAFQLLIFSILLFWLAFPNGPMPWLAWIAHAPFLIIIFNLTFRRTLLLALIYGSIIWYVSTWWFVIGLQNIGGLPLYYALPLSLIPALIGSAPYILFFIIAKRLNILVPNSNPVSAAALLTLLITISPNPFPGSLANSQYLKINIIQICEVGGVSLLLFFINISNVCFAQAWLTRSNRKLAIKYLVVAILTPFLIYSYGYFKILSLEKIDKTLKNITFGIIQPNIPIKNNFLPIYVNEPDRKNDLSTAIHLTRWLVSANPDIEYIVWPELPISFSIVNQPDDFYAIDQLIKEIKIPLILNAFFYDTNNINEERSFFNVVHFLRDSAEPSATYKKTRLIPFGEYLPFENYLPFLKRLLPNVRRYTAAKEPDIFELEPGLKAAPVVCLESIYSELIAQFAKKGANIIINPSNDSYFGFSPGAYVHLSMVTFRAVEYRIPIVRVSNSGVSQVLDRMGRPLLASTPNLFRSDAFKVRVAVPDKGIYYQPNNNTVFLCCLIIFLDLFMHFRVRSS